MNDDRPPTSESGDVDGVAAEHGVGGHGVGGHGVGEHGDLIGDATTGHEAAESSAGSVLMKETATHLTPPASARTQSRITVAALVVFAAAAILLVVSIVQHG